MLEHSETVVFHSGIDVVAHGIEPSAAEQLLIRLGIPCLIRRMGLPENGRTLIRFGLDESGRPCAITDRGSLRLEATEWGDVAESFAAKSAELEIPFIWSDGEE